MDFVIVTGLSGAGKSKAINAMEDIGFYCVDNLPPVMIPLFYEMCQKQEVMPKKVAVVTDTRGGELFNSLDKSLSELDDNCFEYKILFLDAPNSILVNRYHETRRKHPLLEKVNGSLEEAIKLEREILDSVKSKADYIIDTASLPVQAMKERIVKLFLNQSKSSMIIHCMSFGFKHGVPLEVDLLFDVRCLPNPFYVESLKPLRGTNKEVFDFVMNKKESQGFKDRLIDMIDYLIPLYQTEGKSQLVIGIGCTGGHHRSVAFAQYLHDYLEEKNYRVSVTHRDFYK